jgi:hypothetical protein
MNDIMTEPYTHLRGTGELGPVHGVPERRLRKHVLWIKHRPGT